MVRRKERHRLAERRRGGGRLAAHGWRRDRDGAHDSRDRTAIGCDPPGTYICYHTLGEHLPYNALWTRRPRRYDTTSDGYVFVRHRRRPLREHPVAKKRFQVLQCPLDILDVVGQVLVLCASGFVDVVQVLQQAVHIMSEYMARRFRGDRLDD